MVFECRHSYKTKPTGCVECGSLKFEKHLGKPINTLKKREDKGFSDGQIVDQTIKETFNEIKKEKNRLSKRTYKVKK